MINYDLKRIKSIIFDVDGVLSKATVSMSAEGDPLRTANMKDGYAMQLAQKLGLRLCIMTGGKTNAVQLRFEKLGIKDIYMGCCVKLDSYNEFKEKYDLKDEEILYMGDDIPDYEVMSRCGCACCPADACTDIKRISRYVSHVKGGHGCARDVIEQVLRAQSKWLTKGEAFGW